MAQLRGMPVRLGPAETALIDQLEGAGAATEAERLRGTGLPTRRVESYHYTDLKSLLRDVPPLPKHRQSALAPFLPIDGAVQLGLVNGVAYGLDALPTGLIATLVSGSALRFRDDVLVRLNMALAPQTLKLDFAAGHMVLIDRRTEGPAAHDTTSVSAFVAPGVSATLIEVFSSSDAAHLTNGATSVVLGHGATLIHIAVDLSVRQARHFASVEYDLSEDSRLRSLVIHRGADLARTQLFARFAGERAHADFTGLNLVSDGQHLDITLDVAHTVPNTTSQERYKQIARGRSRGVFQGRIVVARDAQKTDAKMMMQGLMLSDEAEIFSKPELEIYADDVVCGHGSTCGQINEDWLFYLMSRGIPRAEAETILVRGFLEELIEPIADERVRLALEGVVEGWLRAS